MSAPLQQQYSSSFVECADSGDDQQVFDSVPFHVDSDLVASRLAVMCAQESGPYRSPGDCLSPDRVAAAALLHPSASASVRDGRKRPVDVTCRTKMVDWCYTICDFCKFDRDVVSVAFSFLDRYLSTPSGSAVLFDRNWYQLASMTALYTAVKINEPEIMSPDVLAGLSRGNYSEEEVVAMERDMLSALEWRTTPPTPAAFLSHFFALLPDEGVVDAVARAALYDSARYQAQLAVLDYGLSTSVRPSVVAYAALINAFSEATREDPSLAGFLNMAGVLVGAFDGQTAEPFRDDSFEDVRRELFIAHTGDAEVEITSSPRLVTAAADGASASKANSRREQWYESSHRSSPRCVSQRELQAS